MVALILTDFFETPQFMSDPFREDSDIAGTLDVSCEDLKSFCRKFSLLQVCGEWGKKRELTYQYLESIF